MSIPTTIPTIATVNGNGDFPGVNGFNYNGGVTHFALYGTFAGATITIQASFEEDGSHVFIPLTDEAGTGVSIQANEVIKIDMGKCKMKFVATGASGTPAIKIKAS